MIAMPLPLYHYSISIRFILSGINEFDRNETSFSFLCISGAYGWWI